MLVIIGINPRCFDSLEVPVLTSPKTPYLKSCVRLLRPIPSETHTQAEKELLPFDTSEQVGKEGAA